MNKIIIDEAKCDGCGLCISPCVEGALELVNGKARVVENLCDGAGLCIGECPQGAISFEKTAQKIDLSAPQHAAVDGSFCCSRCGASEMTVELLKGRFKGEDRWYCVKCLPTLIHG